MTQIGTIMLAWLVLFWPKCERDLLHYNVGVNLDKVCTYIGMTCPFSSKFWQTKGYNALNYGAFAQHLFEHDGSATCNHLSIFVWNFKNIKIDIVIKSIHANW